MALILLGLTACDESGPNSQHCVEVRNRWSTAKYHRDEAARYGHPVQGIDAALNRLVNENWQCFR